MDEYNGGVEGLCLWMVADFHYFDEEQDLDPGLYQS